MQSTEQDQVAESGSQLPIISLEKERPGAAKQQNIQKNTHGGSNLNQSASSSQEDSASEKGAEARVEEKFSALLATVSGDTKAQRYDNDSEVTKNTKGGPSDASMNNDDSAKPLNLTAKGIHNQQFKEKVCSQTVTEFPVDSKDLDTVSSTCIKNSTKLVEKLGEWPETSFEEGTSDVGHYDSMKNIRSCLWKIRQDETENTTIPTSAPSTFAQQAEKSEDIDLQSNNLKKPLSVTSKLYSQKQASSDNTGECMNENYVLIVCILLWIISSLKAVKEFPACHAQCKKRLKDGLAQKNLVSLFDTFQPGLQSFMSVFCVKEERPDSTESVSTTPGDDNDDVDDTTVPHFNGTLQSEAFASERSRMDTYIGWPHNHVPQTPEMMAHAGFFYTGNGDIVCCHCCGLALGKWRCNENPIEEHVKHNPDCNHIQRVRQRAQSEEDQSGGASALPGDSGATLENSGLADINVERDLHQQPFPVDRTAVQETGDQNEDAEYGARQVFHPELEAENIRPVSTVSQVNGRPFTAAQHPAVSDVERISADAMRASFSVARHIAHPHMSQLTQRRESWIVAVPLLFVIFEELSLAGFFYEEFSGMALCFVCGLSLDQWNECDSPAAMHLSNSPHCVYAQSYMRVTMRFQGRQVRNYTYQPVDSEQPAMFYSLRWNTPGDMLNELPSPALPFQDAPRTEEPAQWSVSENTDENMIDVNRRQHGEGNSSSSNNSSVIPPASGHHRPPAVPKKTSKTASRTNTQRNQPVRQNPCSCSEPSEGSFNNTIGGRLSSASTLSKSRQKQKDTDSKAYPQSLKEENKKLKEMQLCKVCLDKPVGVTFLPCGHLVCCETCAPHLKHCTICRVRIKGTIKTYMS